MDKYNAFCQNIYSPPAMCVGLVTSWTNCSCARNLERRIGNKFYFVSWSCNMSIVFLLDIPSVGIFLQNVGFFLGGDYFKKITLYTTTMTCHIPAKAIFPTVAVVEVADYQCVNVLCNALLQVSDH